MTALLALAVVVGLLLVWSFYRSNKRRPLDAPPGGDFIFTGKRFLDPACGEMVEVWRSPETGKRVYVRARKD